MRTYYRGPDAVVTEAQFVWQHPTVQIFAIDDLDDVRLVRAATGWRPGVALALAFGLSIVATVAGLRFGVLAAIPPVAALAVLVSTVLRRRGKSGWEIRARYHTREVTVYTCADPRIFNQVTRALRRTIERRAVRQAHGLAVR